MKLFLLDKVENVRLGSRLGKGKNTGVENNVLET